MAKRALIAIGGNSLINPQHGSDMTSQWEAVHETARHMADMIADGWDLVITHGNGPQAGFNLRRSELAAAELYPLPLDLIVAHTQGSIGYMLQQAMENELGNRSVLRPVVTIVSQVLVDKDDPGFKRPTKPIGSFLSEANARAFESQGWSVVEDAGRGWRRVVASPIPIEILERQAVRILLESGTIVIAAGGGGIPVIRNAAGQLQGVFAVIDKDRASSLLARDLSVDLFLISTGVDQVALNYNKPTQRNLDRITLAEARQFAAEGHFAPGSMLPKIEAACDFVAATGKPAVITSPENLTRALHGRAGTWIVG